MLGDTIGKWAGVLCCDLLGRRTDGSMSIADSIPVDEAEAIRRDVAVFGAKG